MIGHYWVGWYGHAGASEAVPSAIRWHRGPIAESFQVCLDRLKKKAPKGRILNVLPRGAVPGKLATKADPGQVRHPRRGRPRQWDDRLPEVLARLGNGRWWTAREIQEDMEVRTPGSKLHDSLMRLLREQIKAGVVEYRYREKTPGPRAKRGDGVHTLGMVGPLREYRRVGT